MFHGKKIKLSDYIAEFIYQKIEEIKDALLNRENATDTNLINITEI